MYFALERAKKLTSELARYMRPSAVAVDGIRYKAGHFRDANDADDGPGDWQELVRGALWGGRDRRYWFRATAVTPEEFAGRPVALRVCTGLDGWDAANPQFLLYVNGTAAQGIDANHSETLLTECAQPGQTFGIDLDAHSGMIDREWILQLELVSIDADVRKLYWDIQVPLAVAERLAPDDRRRLDIMSVISETLNQLDLRLPGSEAFSKSIRRGSDYISEQLYGRLCGPGDITATCVGHTHLDVAWLWTVRETREKAARSYATVLKLMEEYPEYVFMSSQPQLYQFVREDHPEIFERIKQRVAEGRWEPEGSMWVEADCNLTSGESLVRQIMFGKRFFREQFGVDSRILWLPDAFGYSGALPQIMAKSGIDYFMTTKISWNQFNQLPYDTFLWQGIDGSCVLTHFITTRDYEAHPSSFFATYNGDLNPSQVMGAWQRYQQKSINDDVLISYGHGDGGGGTTREMLENGRRLARGIPGAPTVRTGTARSFFERLERRVSGNRYLPKWVGELYLELHRGTYTSMGRNKRYNRKSELMLCDAETLAVLAMLLGKTYPERELDENWRIVLLNQFHDILPGSSIKEVYADSKRDYDGVMSALHDMVNESLSYIARDIGTNGPSVVVFNTLGFNRTDVACFVVPDTIQHPCLMDSSGSAVQCGVSVENGIRKAIFVASDVPAKGHKTYTLVDGGCPGNPPASVSVSTFRLENKYFSIQLDEKGTLVSLYDKIAQRQVLKKGERGNRILAFEDKPLNWDNWDIDIFYRDKMWEVDRVERIEILEENPVRGGIRIHKVFMRSRVVQDIFIYGQIPRIDFSTHVDWKESQILLRAVFPVDVHADKATYDIQFGNIERSAHMNTSWDVAQFEVCAHKWADLSEEGYGVSLMNDCKYGHSIKNGDIGLTLLKSGIEPNAEADREKHRFTYSLYPHAGNWKRAKTAQMACGLNVPFYTRLEPSHPGRLPQEYSMVQVDSDNVMLETVKKAHGRSDIVVRLHEYHGRRTRAAMVLAIPFTSVWECDLLENEIVPAPAEGPKIPFEIRPYEIKTFKIGFCTSRLP